MQQVSLSSEIGTEIISGLEADPKYIPSKFFYDSAGSMIFQDITKMPEYYLTDAEAEILRKNKHSLTSFFNESRKTVDLVELGAGDGEKTRILLESLLEKRSGFRYIPVDISAETNLKLANALRKEYPGLHVEPRNGDYFEMTGKLSEDFDNRKVLLFLGSNLGNYTIDESIDFLRKLNRSMKSSDLLLLGLDLRKDPNIIRNAYDDPHGYTRKFNLNLLERMNRELGANFRVENFTHVPVYDPSEGAAKSYLVSNEAQEVYFEALDRTIEFSRWETIFTEISQKYDKKLIEEIARRSGYSIVHNYFDSRHYFVNTLWRK